MSQSTNRPDSTYQPLTHNRINNQSADTQYQVIQHGASLYEDNNNIEDSRASSSNQYLEILPDPNNIPDNNKDSHQDFPLGKVVTSSLGVRVLPPLLSDNSRL